MSASEPQQSEPGPAPPGLPFDLGGRVIAITGASGFIGGEVMRRIERDPRYARIIAVDVRRPGIASAKTRFHKVDLTLPGADASLAQIFTQERVDTVLHAAFLSSPSHNTAWAHELESLGTLHVLGACGACPMKRLVMWSQTLVYGPSPHNPNYLTEDHELREGQTCQFILDKIEAERQLRSFAREHPEVAVSVLRTAPILGPTVSNFATRLFRMPVCPMLLGFDPLMQFVHEEDVIDAFLIALAAEQRGPFNIVADGVLPYSTVLALLGRIPVRLPYFMAYPLGKALWAAQVTSMPPEFLDLLRHLCVADGERAQRQLRFRPRYDIRQTLEDFCGITNSVREVKAS